jgi:hypothetical protein
VGSATALELLEAAPGDVLAGAEALEALELVELPHPASSRAAPSASTQMTLLAGSDTAESPQEVMAAAISSNACT